MGADHRLLTRTGVVGQEIRYADGFLLVYSVSSRESFEETVTNYQQILRFKKKGSFPAIIVANKCDLEQKREIGIHGKSLFPPHINPFIPQTKLPHFLAFVTSQEGQELARYLGCMFIETSAKKDIRVDEAFTNLLRGVHKQLV